MRAEGGGPDVDIQQIIDWHSKGYNTTSDEAWNRSPICLCCRHAWPCDTAVLAAELARVTDA